MHKRLYPLAHLGVLIDKIPGLPHNHGSATLLVRSYILLVSFIVESYDISRRLHNLRCGAVVHIKHNLTGISVVIAEVEHDIRLGASEAIDALVIIPDNEQIILRLCKKPYCVILNLIDILKLIDKDILKLALPCRKDVPPRHEKLVGIAQHILKIYLSAAAQLTGILLINASEYIRRAVG